MKIFEVFDDEHQSSEYHMRLQSKVLDYLTSVAGIGVETIHVNQLISTFHSHNIDISPEQIDDILSGTGFEKQGDKIIRNGSAEMEEPADDEPPKQPDPEREQEMQGQKVSNMAQNQLSKDDQ